MIEPFHSSVWYRVAELTPRLRAHGEVRHHRYRSRTWYVLSDPLTGKVHRFTPAAYGFLRALDGKTTVDAIWKRMASDLAEQAPTQDEIVRLLAQLHRADLLYGHRLPDVDALQRHVGHQRRSGLMNAIRNPMSVVLPLWDPDTWLERHIDIVRGLFGFGAGAGVAWLALVVPALVLAVLHLDDLARDASRQLLSPEGLLAMAFVFPAMKLLHEAGHAFALKAFGGAVHKSGLMLITFYPVPYVDATMAAALTAKSQRIVVGAAGMLIELMIGALALYVWLAVEPGLARTVAFNAMVVATVSVLVVNGNPLLRFDGYYILSDAIEIPNLAQRSSRFWSQLTTRWFAGIHEPIRDDATPSERAWFMAYGPLSFAYRLFILLTLSIWVASEFFAIGVAIAVVSLVTTLVLPLFRGLMHVLRQAQNQAIEGRVRLRLAAVTAAVAGIAIGVPLPHWTLSEGVVWLPETGYVRTGTDGVVQSIHAAPGARISTGDVVARLQSLPLDTDIAVDGYRIDELTAKLSSEQFTNRPLAEITRVELNEARSRLSVNRAKHDKLIVRSSGEGTLVLLRADDLAGRHLRKGDTIAFVVPDKGRIIRALVRQDDIDLVRSNLRSARIVLANDLNRSHSARVVREVPAAGVDLPSKALNNTGGGQVAADPKDSAKAAGRIFQLDLELDAPLIAPAFGARAYVRFQYAPEPLAAQAYRRVRQLLLSRFDA